MNLKVGQKYRTHYLSFRPGGYTVVVEEISGRKFEYDKIKYPESYINKVKREPHILDAWVKQDN